MSSQRRIIASRANGAKSHGPKTQAGKMHSAQNAIRHGLLAKCILLDGETPENFQILLQMHLDRFQPNDGVEYGIVEEMAAAKWRMYRAMTMETQALNAQLARQVPASNKTFFADAFDATAASPSTALLQRYEARLQLMYQRALRSFALARAIPGPNPADVPQIEMPSEPSPIPEHPAKSTQPADSTPAPATGRTDDRFPTSVGPKPSPPAQPPADPCAPLEIDWPSPKSPEGASK